MKKQSKTTKKTRSILWILRSIDLAILVLPLLVYVIIALIGGGAVKEKVAVVGTVLIALILVAFNIITKKHLRSPLWIVILGLYVAINNLLPLIGMIAVSTIIDEFALSPLIEKYKVRLESHKAIDQRIGVEEKTDELREETE